MLMQPAALRVAILHLQISESRDQLQVASVLWGPKAYDRASQSNSSSSRRATYLAGFQPHYLHYITNNRNIKLAV